jgi:hypothetical protein
MIKTLELKGSSCLTESADDEVLFVLCARDPIAPLVVQYWVQMYSQLKTGGKRNLTSKEAKKCKDAMSIAQQMYLWRTRKDGSAATMDRLRIQRRGGK